MNFNAHQSAFQHRLRAALGLLAACALWLAPCSAGAQSATPTELQIKAGFIYNFALFTEWPAQSFPNAASPLQVCIAGDSKTLQDFDHLKTKKIKGRAVSVGAFGDTTSGKTCQIIYIPTILKAEAAHLLRQVSGPGVLTIGDADGFSRLGGIIAFFREGNKLRFAINTDAAQRAGLKLSSRLLKLAKIVTDQEPPR